MAGIRDIKTVDGITYRYDTLNGKVVRQTWTQNGKEKVFDIIYDAGGQPYACVYEGYRYYYVLNQQGDVIQIVGSEGTVCAEYRYDAWGNILNITGPLKDTLGADNPIRYRGYYYDTETGFYYLQSRYYDPSIGRFINTDSYASTGLGFIGYNMFAYCNNNPVVHCDECGTRFNDTNHGKFAPMLHGANNRNIYYVYFPTPDLFETGTVIIGGGGSAYLGYGGSVSGGIAVDSDGDVALVGTLAIGGGSPSYGFSGSFTYSTVDDVSKLKGSAEYAGHSVSLLLAAIGYERAEWTDEDTGEKYYSYTLYIGPPSTLFYEAHGGISFTGVFGGD